MLVDKFILAQIVSGHLRDDELKAFSLSDWDFLLRLAQKEGISPLVYWTLSKSKRLSFAPETVRNNLRVMYSTTWFQNQQIFSDLSLLSSSLNSVGIPVVALKGACFILTIYPDIGLRPMGDLDLLIPEPKLKHAINTANNMGYSNIFPEVSSGLKNMLSHEICLRKEGKIPTILELHRNLVAEKSFDFAVPVDWFWKQTECVSGVFQTKFKNLLMLTPTAQLLYAAVHAILQHGGEQAPLRWFYDIHLLIVSYRKRIDWELLLTQAKLFEWSSALSVALSKTHDYFDTPIPEHVLQSLSALEDRHQDLVALKMSKPPTRILLEYQRLFSLSWYGRFRVAIALLIPAPAYMRWRYKLKSGWSLPWYYLVRWWGIIKDGFRTLMVLLGKR